MATLMLCLNAFPGLCLLKSCANATLFSLQYVFMGFFKLGALHYSFSRSQLHHRKGYPLWVFVVMTTIGILVIVSAVILFTLVHPLQCIGLCAVAVVDGVADAFCAEPAVSGNVQHPDLFLHVFDDGA